ncbi:MAG: TIGR00730 family Rossman fold protein [Burkholderiaceae bacterium]|nr:TIGR00730 family Rossman fold protein [Burkholderiaceae bacterium]
MRAACVFCGSQPGARPTYLQAAVELGALLARRGWTVVYGGGHVGMMGALADSALAAGGRVVGVIELLVVDSMHTRKRVMAGRSDAFVVLPGGYGTFEEMFEMVTWRQLELHGKPVGLANVDGYFDHLLAFLRHAAEQQFIRPQHRDLLSVEASVPALLDRLQRQAGADRRAGAGDLGRG